MKSLLFPRHLSERASNLPIYIGLAQALRDRGVEVTLAVTQWTGATESAARLGIEVIPIRPRWEPVTRLAAHLLRGPALPRCAAAASAWLADKRRSFDVIHVEDVYPSGTAMAMAMRRAGSPAALVLKPMGEDVLVHPASGYGFRRHAVPRWLIDWTLRRTDGLRVTSDVVAAAVDGTATPAPQHGIPVSVSPETMAVARAGGERRSRARRRARQEVEECLGRTSRHLVLTLGRLHPFKGLDVAIRALADVPGADLVIVGPSLQVRGVGDMALHLERLAGDLGLADRVHVLGEATPAEAARFLAAADVVAVPSHIESHNKVCIEAAAAGTPFVVTRTTGIAAAVPAEIGIVVAPADARELAAAICSVLGGSWGHDAAAAARFVERFSPAAIAAQLLGLYREAVRIRRTRSR